MMVTFICLKMTRHIATIVERQLQNVETIATQVFFYQPDAVSVVYNCLTCGKGQIAATKSSASCVICAAGTYQPAEVAAETYEASLRDAPREIVGLSPSGMPVLDLVLLGSGADGHCNNFTGQY